MLSHKNSTNNNNNKCFSIIISFMLWKTVHDFTFSLRSLIVRQVPLACAYRHCTRWDCIVNCDSYFTFLELLKLPVRLHQQNESFVRKTFVLLLWNSFESVKKKNLNRTKAFWKLTHSFRPLQELCRTDRLKSTCLLLHAAQMPLDSSSWQVLRELSDGADC